MRERDLPSYVQTRWLRRWFLFLHGDDIDVTFCIVVVHLLSISVVRRSKRGRKM